MDQEKLKNALDKGLQIDGEKKKITCQFALKTAKYLDVSLKLIGDYCNQEKIQIINCQLGCFGNKIKK